MSDHYATTWRELWANIRRSPMKQRNAALLLAGLTAYVAIVAATIAFIARLI